MRSNIDNGLIQQYLARAGIIEDHIQTKKRNALMQKLCALVPEFEEEIARRKTFPRGDFKCQLQPFGSYGLGGYLAGADIDLVLLGTRDVERRDFYRTFRGALRRITENIEVIKRTAVPIIKCNIDSIPVDISFVSLKLSTVPRNINLVDDRYLEGLDRECFASMDGPRTQKFILDHIEPDYMPVFRCALQCIKYWATQRFLYGKPMGYLNGSTWTFLLLKTYMSVNSGHISVFGLLQEFFDMWSNWPWPQPVLLTEHISGLNGTAVNYEDIEDFKNSVMPIVSPCYPVCSSTPFATVSTLRVITQEFKRAQTIMKSDYFSDINSLLMKLFKELNFFGRYKHFLRVMVTSETIKSDETWKRKMATAIPKLLELLEAHPDITFIHPYTKSYTESYSYSTLQGKAAIREGYSDYVENFSSPLQPGKLFMTNHLIGLEVSATVPEIDISNEIHEFIEELEAKRNDRDVDVTFKISSSKRSDLRLLVANS